MIFLRYYFITNIGVQTDCATPALARFGSDQLRRDFLAPAIAGDHVACVGISEPGVSVHNHLLFVAEPAVNSTGYYQVVPILKSTAGSLWTSQKTS